MNALVGDFRVGGCDHASDYYIGIGNKLGAGFDPIRGGIALAERDCEAIVCGECGEDVDECACFDFEMEPKINEDDTRQDR